MLVGCATGSFGLMRGSGDGVTTTRSQTSLYATLGARLGAEFHLGGRWSLAPRLDVNANLVRAELRINNRDVWRAPPVGVSPGVTALVYFP